MQQTDYERRGYLHEDYRLFHLSSALAEDTAFHYHEFHKLVFFLAGRGNYIVEGRTHVLRPYDVVLVRQGAIHKAQIDLNERYERVILYISPDFLRAQSTAVSALDACFHLPADGRALSCARRLTAVLRCCAHWTHSRRRSKARPMDMICSHVRRCCSCWSCSAAA